MKKKRYEGVGCGELSEAIKVQGLIGLNNFFFGSELRVTEGKKGLQRLDKNEKMAQLICSILLY